MTRLLGVLMMVPFVALGWWICKRYLDDLGREVVLLTFAILASCVLLALGLVTLVTGKLFGG
jgi:hypothetical protein